MPPLESKPVEIAPTKAYIPKTYTPKQESVKVNIVSDDTPTTYTASATQEDLENAWQGFLEANATVENKMNLLKEVRATFSTGEVVLTTDIGFIVKSLNDRKQEIEDALLKYINKKAKINVVHSNEKFDDDIFAGNDENNSANNDLKPQYPIEHFIIEKLGGKAIN